MTPEELKAIIKDIVVEVVKRSNEDREIAIANLRLEVNNLADKVKNLSYIVDLLSPYAQKGVIVEIDELNKEITNIKKEKLYKNFFSDNGGFLFQFAEIISDISCLGKSESDINVIKKFYARNFYPILNKVEVLKSLINNSEENVNLSEQNLDELIVKRNNLKQIVDEANSSKFSKFYIGLWEAIEEHINFLCNPQYEDRFNENNQVLIKEELIVAIRDIENQLVNNGIEILYEPTDDYLDSFMVAASHETLSKPLIRRSSDKYIYVYGIYNENKPLLKF